MYTHRIFDTSSQIQKYSQRRRFYERPNATKVGHVQRIQLAWALKSLWHVNPPKIP